MQYYNVLKVPYWDILVEYDIVLALYCTILYFIVLQYNVLELCTVLYCTVHPVCWLGALPVLNLLFLS